MPFPPGFHWGVATSALQIEGALADDGRSASNWDEFCRRPGTIERSETPEQACDHYRRWEEDLDLMSEMGVTSYRFSVAWPRVMPAGDDRVNPKGLAFYDRLVDGLLSRGIRPVVTLYHMDHPLALEESGGWLDRGMVAPFIEYARTVFGALGDRVEMWLTTNEPGAQALYGCLWGSFPPGHTDDLEGYLRISHHQLLAHGEVVRLYREMGLDAPIGLVLGLAPTYGESSQAADQRAAWMWDGFTNRLFLDGILRGAYPEDVVAQASRSTRIATVVLPGDLETIRQPIDVLGINYYTHRVIRADGDATFGGIPVPTGVQTTVMGSEIVPDGLHEIVMRVTNEYHVPIVISENGAAFDDEPGDDGFVDDQHRVGYLRDHLTALKDAIDDGADVRGYFVWSLLDNFEWMNGYRPRFGLVRVDYPTQRRIPKASARFYAEMISTNGSETSQA